MPLYLGIFCLYYGIASLLFNEPIVWLKRRYKPWWRNDTDAASDQQMLDALRVMTYVVGIVMVELGVYLLGITSVALMGRIAAYAVCGLAELGIRHLVTAKQQRRQT